MAFNDDVLDFGEMRDDAQYEPNVVEYTVEGITRFGHYIIDHIVRSFIMVTCAFLLEGISPNSGNGILLAYLIPYLLYYPLMEFYYGKTVGKMLTKSTVVRADGGKITLGQAVGRSLCRFIPFNAFSFLGVTAIGWHDSISQTRVVNDTFLHHNLEYDRYSS